MATTRPKGLRHDYITTSDNVKLSYYTTESTTSAVSKPVSPALIISHGAFSSALTASDLALALSGNYAVYLLSRRSRGLSGPYPENITNSANVLCKRSSETGQTDGKKVDEEKSYRTYTSEFAAEVLKTDVQDLVTLIQHTGATRVLGISVGALVVLQALHTLSSDGKAISNLTHITLFEPPLLFPSSTHLTSLPLITRYEQEIAAHDIANACVTAMKIVQLGPKLLRACPRWIIRFLTSMILSAEVKDEARKSAARDAKAAVVPGEGAGRVEVEAYDEDLENDDLGAVSMGTLAPVLRYDFAVCEAMIGPAERFKGIADGRRVLLLGGSESPEYFKFGLEELGRVMGAEAGGQMEGSRKVVMKGVGHEVLGNANRGGNVAFVMETLEKFFSAQDISDGVIS